MSQPEFASAQYENLTGLQVKVLQDLLDIKAIKFGNFRLKHHETNPEAPLSPYYLDLRLLRSFPQVLRLTANLYEEMLSGLKYDFLADVPNAATPITTTISLDLNIGFRTPRKEKKDHGFAEEIDGFLPTDVGKTAVLIDDLATRGVSKTETIKKLTERGIIVRDVVVLVDREEGGKAELAKSGIKFHSAFTLSQIADYYLRVGMIDQQTYKRVKGTVQDPSI